MHKIMSHDPDRLIGDCLECGKQSPIRMVKSKGRKPYPKCKVRIAEEKARDHVKNYDPEIQRWKQVRYVFNITKEQWEALFLSQGNKCAICLSDSPTGRGWHIDHDHECCPGRKSCGKCIRGILCSNCNTAIGLLKDDEVRISNALEYIRKG